MKQTVAAPQFGRYPEDWHLSPVLISGDFAFFSGGARSSRNSV
jgi:hypothetical protein